MSKVSVIVPIYNVERYLERCIESILNQTYVDFELILVDDGSTDKCGKLCDEYKERDERIVVIHKKNGGVSNARNRALDIVQGEYITFCDADDCINEDWLEVLIKKIQSEEADAVIGGYEIVDTDGKVTFCPDRDEEQIYLKDDTDRMLHYRRVFQRKFGWEVCTRLFKTDLIKKYNIRFCETCENFAEDLGFVLEYDLYVRKICVVEYAGYKNVLRVGSMMDKSKSVIKLNQVNEVSYYLADKYNQVMSKGQFKDCYPIIHFCIVNNQLQKMDWDGKLGALKEEMTKIKRIDWFMQNMKSIKKIKKEMRLIFDKDFIRYAMVLSRYCSHKRFFWFRVDRFLTSIIHK